MPPPPPPNLHFWPPLEPVLCGRVPHPLMSLGGMRFQRAAGRGVLPWSGGLMHKARAEAQRRGRASEVGRACAPRTPWAPTSVGTYPLGTQLRHSEGRYLGG